ncbi:MAG: transposase [Polaromonas sp.]
MNVPLWRAKLTDYLACASFQLALAYYAPLIKNASVRFFLHDLVSEKFIRCWCAQFRQGKRGMAKTSRARYTLEFKQELTAVENVQSIEAVARTSGVADHTVFNWVKTHRQASSQERTAKRLQVPITCRSDDSGPSSHA